MVEIRKYDDDILKTILHDKLKKAFDERFDKKDHGYKITI
jgi:hypothetical protein